MIQVAWFRLLEQGFMRKKKLKIALLLFLAGFLTFFYQLRSCSAAELTASKQDTAVSGDPQVWRFAVDQDKSQINFFLKGNVHDTHGSVNKIAGTVNTVVSSAGGLKQATIAITIQAKDLDTKNEKRDQRMQNKFLEAKKYPEIVFQSTDLQTTLEPQPFTLATQEQPLSFDLHGKLMLHGITKKIVVKVTAYLFHDRLITNGTAVLDLRDFGIKNPSMLFLRVDNEVQLDFHVELLRILQ